MNLDERIEALAQSVELLSHMQKATEQHIVTLAQHGKRLEKLVTDIAEGTARLLQAIESHERRISDLEEHQRQ